jgi:O-antigen ligase
MVTKLDKLSPCSADGNRIYMIIVGAKLLKQNPLLGVGVGDVMDEFKKYVNNNLPEFKCSFRFNQLHNQYIQILVQVGIIGLLLFFYIFYNLYKESDDKRLSFLIILAILLSFNGDVLMVRQFSMALISFIIVAILREKKYE